MKQIYFFLLFSLTSTILYAPSAKELDHELQHECGLALIRLFKPVTYYRDKYNDSAWGIHKLCLLMEKQRNRGEGAAGYVATQFDLPPGQPFMQRCRFAEKNPLACLFEHIAQELSEHEALLTTGDDITIEQHCCVIGNVYLGHLRYATHGGNDIKFSQPYLRKNSIPAKYLALAGNFNMSNNSEIMLEIISRGLVPSSKADTHLIINHIGYYLDKAYENALACALEYASPPEAARLASNNLDIALALQQAAACWDGGYVFAGILGNGDTFICRDPAGIRPGYYYSDEEIFAAASERSALMNAFTLTSEKIQEIPRGHVIIIKKNGTIELHQFAPILPERQCIFERIYFSRASDPAIYQERKELGVQLAHRLFKELKYSVRNTIFSYIPNTSEISFYGLIEQLNQLVLQQGSEFKPRVEKIIFKDQAIRTFIANDTIRSDLVSKVYDVVKDIVSDQDTLVILDDSIVRGVTLRESIIQQLITLNPKKIIIVSASPIILYPDCYGIDISQIGTLIGFQAAIALTKERGNQQLIDEIYQECVALKESNHHSCYNPVKKLYDQFTQQELETKIAQLIYPYNSHWKNELQVIYQTIEGMQQAIPHYTGDWYFTGDYATAGGYNVVITSFINWYLSISERAY
jgi:amidophosphoribosyltransferase